MIGSDEYVDAEIPPEDAAARVLDTERNILFQPQPFHSITAHIPRLTEYASDELLDDVEIQDPPVDETPFRMDTMEQRDDTDSLAN